MVPGLSRTISALRDASARMRSAAAPGSELSESKRGALKKVLGPRGDQEERTGPGVLRKFVRRRATVTETSRQLVTYAIEDDSGGLGGRSPGSPHFATSQPQVDPRHPGSSTGPPSVLACFARLEDGTFGASRCRVGSPPGSWGRPLNPVWPLSRVDQIAKRFQRPMYGHRALPNGDVGGGQLTRCRRAAPRSQKAVGVQRKHRRAQGIGAAACRAASLARRRIRCGSFERAGRFGDLRPHRFPVGHGRGITTGSREETLDEDSSLECPPGLVPPR